MLLTLDKLFLSELDTNIPELKRASELYKNGEVDAACELLVTSFKDVARERLLRGVSIIAPSADEEGELVWADEICDGWVSACGFRHHFEDGEIVWTANPTYNGYKEWPYQLSRHAEFATLAYAYRKTGEEKYARRFSEMMSSWLAQAECPESASPGSTICWRTIEAGIRFGHSLDAWNRAICAFLDSPSVDSRLWLDVIRSIWEHGYRLSQFSSKTSNWLIMEMNGLAHLSILYPIFKSNREWQSFADARLTAELKSQIYPDGFQFELSSGYHWCVMLNYIAYFELLSNFQIAISEEMLSILLNMAHAYIKITAPDRRIPDFNDGERYFTKEMAQAMLKFAKDDAVLRYFATDGIEGEPPQYSSVAFPYAGFSISRTGWGEKDFWAFFESAPFGRAHQHEDKLGFYLFAYGKELLSDGGNYEYDGSDIRKFAISTRAHNTALVDYEGQNRRAGYKWVADDLNTPSDLSWKYGEEYEVAEGEYRDGYGENLIPVTHRRKVIFFKRGLDRALPFFVLIDDFVPQDDREHTYEVLFQLGTEPIKVSGKRVTAEHMDGVTLSLISSADPIVKIAEKSPRFMGWRSDRSTREEHEHFPAPAVLFTEHGVAARVLTAVYPTNSPEIPIKKIEAKTDGFVLEFTDGKRYEFSDGAPEFSTRPASYYIKVEK